MMLVLFGYALTLDVDNVPIVVWDQSGTAQSRRFFARFGGPRKRRYFSIRGAWRTGAKWITPIDSGGRSACSRFRAISPRDRRRPRGRRAAHRRWQRLEHRDHRARLRPGRGARLLAKPACIETIRRAACPNRGSR